MSALRKDEDVRIQTAFQFTNSQIDKFLVAGKMHYAELAMLIETILFMANINGPSLFAYVLHKRKKTLVLNHRGYLNIRDVNGNTDHSAPEHLRDLPIFNSYRQKPENIRHFIPLFTLSPELDTILLKQTMWIRSLQHTARHIPIVLSARLVPAKEALNNQYAAVVMPVMHLVRDADDKRSLVFSYIQVPDSCGSEIVRLAKQGTKTFKIIRSRNKAKHYDITADTDEMFQVADYNITDEVMLRAGSRYAEFVTEYGKRLAVKNSEMPIAQRDALIHTLIAMQRPIHEIEQTLNL